MTLYNINNSQVIMYHSFVQKNDLVLFHELLQTTCSVNTMMDVVNRIPNIKPVYLSAQQLQEQYGHLPFIRHHFFQSAETTERTNKQLREEYFGGTEHAERKKKKKAEFQKKEREERNGARTESSSGGMLRLWAAFAAIIGALALSGNGGATEKSVVPQPPVSVSGGELSPHRRDTGVTAEHPVVATPLLNSIPKGSPLDSVPDPLDKYRKLTAKELNAWDGGGWVGTSVTPIMKLVKDSKVSIKEKLEIIAVWAAHPNVNLATTDSGHNKIAYDYALELNIEELNIDHGEKDKLVSLLVPTAKRFLGNVNRFESPFKDGLIQTAEKILDNGILNKFSDNQKAQAAFQTEDIPLLKKILGKSNKPYILFDLAIKKGQHDFIRRLNAADFNMNIKKKGLTALEYAARYSDAEMVTTLLANGATAGKQEVYKRTKLALKLAEYIRGKYIEMHVEGAFSDALISSAFGKLSDETTNFGLQYSEISNKGKNKEIISVLEKWEVHLEKHEYLEELGKAQESFDRTFLKCIAWASYNIGAKNQRQKGSGGGDFFGGYVLGHMFK